MSVFEEYLSALYNADPTRRVVKAILSQEFMDALSEECKKATLMENDPDYKNVPLLTCHGVPVEVGDVERVALVYEAPVGLTKNEILKLPSRKLEAAAALQLGLALYGREGLYRTFTLTEVGDREIPGNWKRVWDIHVLPIFFSLGGENWLMSRLHGEYPRKRLSEKERELYLDALLEFCQVDIARDWSGDWNYREIWRLINASEEQHLRAFLIAKNAVK